MNLSTWGNRLFAAVVCLMTVSTAFAQNEGGRSGGGGFGFGGSASIYQLVGLEPVQKELALTAEVAAKAKTLSEEATKDLREGIEYGNLRDASQEERTKKMAEIREKLTANTEKVAKTYDPKLAELISAEQLTRLKQIDIQAAGVLAYQRPDVVKALELTKEQQEKLAEFEKTYTDKRRELFGGGGGGEERLTKIRELSDARTKDTEAILTVAQKAKMAEMKGKDFDTTQLRRGGGVGRPPRN